ncbi:hypothetical protein NADE_008060 [Nannochloris sp. 'desiccata']|nr:hypothetical protein KSW81_006195 [Chlorella desiccata (nom. nud.)]KAH7619774.1 hypothetical protein NADE_008060 [Chlorella desiccata (nom. nud.)]
MPRFRKGVVTSPLLPAHGASSLGLSRKKTSPSSALAGVSEAGLALSLEARRSAALNSRPSRELPGAHVPTKNAALQQRLDALIEEATKIAQERGILTEVDAAEKARIRALNKDEDWTWVLDDNDTRSSDQRTKKEAATQRAVAGTCRSKDGSRSPDKECGPHGVCISNQCSCAVAFSGTYCGHSVLLSHPYTPEGVPIAEVGYEGNLILLRDSRLQQTEDLKPFAFTNQSGLEVGEIFESCAVIGDAANLLLGNYGATIDSHSFIFRTGRPFGTRKNYTQFIGAKSRVHLISTLSENPNFENFETTTTAMVLTPPSFENLEHVGSMSAASKMKTRIIHPRLFQHLHVAFGSSPSSSSAFPSSEALVAVMLALNTCRSVAVFGIATLPGLPSTYYDICGSTKSAEETLQKQQQLHSWVVLRKYHEAGLLAFGEDCILECVDPGSEEKCNVCRKQHNLDPIQLIAAMKACP